MVCICYELLFSISSILIYYGTQSDNRVISYCRLNLLRASVLNFERLDILRDSIGHPSKNLLSVEFAQSFYFQFRACRYITGLNRISELKVIVVCICNEILFSISSISIYYSIGYWSFKLLWFAFATSFCFQFQASQYITGLNRTTE